MSIGQMMLDSPEIVGALFGAGGTGSAGAILVYFLRRTLYAYDHKIELLQDSITILKDIINDLKLDLARSDVYRSAMAAESEKLARAATDIASIKARIDNLENIKQRH